jgi:2-hydroxychromene-2-carboxylate isomerase
MWRDVERLCAKYALPWKKPSVFPQNSVLASRVVCAAEGHDRVPELVRALYLANFAEDRDIADRDVVRSVCANAGALDALERAEAPENKARLRAAVDQARSLGVFGAPNFFVAGEHFFGQDRLDDAVAWAAKAR